MSRRKGKKIIILFTTFLVLVFAGFTWYYQQQDEKEASKGSINEVTIEHGEILDPNEEAPAGPDMKCVVFDVGDALAVLIDKGNTEVLYDCGYAETSEALVEKLTSYVDGELDYLICSHSHADHMGGVPAVCKAFDVTTIVTSGETKGESDQFDAAMKAIKKENAEVIEDDNMQFILGDGAKLNIIDRLDPEDTDNPNDLSVVAKITYADHTILLTGDGEKDAEKALLGHVGEVDLFIAGHHFSDTSNSAVFLQETQPKTIIGSYAKDSEYGFPHKSAIERCMAVTSDIYSTAKSGTIVYTIHSDGTSEISALQEDSLR